MADHATHELWSLLGFDIPIEDEFTSAEDDEGHAPPVSVPSQLRASSALEVFEIVARGGLREVWLAESVAVLPRALSVSPALIRRMTDEVVWGGPDAADRTMETIGSGASKRTELTRVEHFVSRHTGWAGLCNGFLAWIASALCGEDMVLCTSATHGTFRLTDEHISTLPSHLVRTSLLWSTPAPYSRRHTQRTARTPAEGLFADKEKLNFKPPGGAGFAPHLDAPSLRVAAVGAARTFMTLMVAIDPMTAKNGCLRVVRGSWSEQKHCEVIRPEDGSDPDSDGRAGAIPAAVADALDFEDVICASGDVVAFNGWVPHRSGVNASPFERRAVFLTYNPLSQGNMHEAYYDKMAELRSAWRAGEVARLADFAAFATVPK